MKTRTATEYVLVIDTDRYSGNYERPLVAYCTGQVGVCEVGNAEAENFRDFMPWKDNPFDDVVVCRPDDDRGALRPAAIWPTPGRTNNGSGGHSDVTPDNPFKWPAYESVAIFFNKRPTQLMIDTIKDRAFEYAANRRTYNEQPDPFKVLGFRWITETTTVTTQEEPL